jgi:hypothetical protein
MASSLAPFSAARNTVLLNFRPEFPHMGFGSDILTYEFVAFVTILLRQASELSPLSIKASAPKSVRLRALEEAIKDWRGFFFIAASTLAIAVVTWIPSIWTVADHIVTKRSEQWIAGNAFGAKVGVFCLFVVVGPLWEIAGTLARYQSKAIEVAREGNKPLSDASEEAAEGRSQAG